MGLMPSKLDCQRRAKLDTLSLHHLGDELFCNLCHELDVHSLGSLATSSRHCQQMLRQDEAWREVCREFGAANLQQLKGMLTLSSLQWRSSQAEDARSPPARDHHIAFGASAGLILFGGNDLRRGQVMSDCWVLDALSGRWHLAATQGPRPAPRTFNADGGGGGILRDAVSQREWLVVYGGLRGEGFRDNETWLLGPLQSDPADWRWQEIEEGGGSQSRLRPTPRFHHTQTVLGSSKLAVLGGHDFMIRPILGVGLLKLHKVTEEGTAPPGEEIIWELLADSRDGPKPRAYHSAVDWHGSALIIFGGASGMASSRFGLQVHADTWVLDTEMAWQRPTWQRIPVDFNGGRCHATAAVLADRWLVIAGGCERVAGSQGEDGNTIMAGLQVRSDLWVLDLELPQCWQKVLDFERPAWWDSTSVVIHDRTMLIFGGHDSSQVNEFNDPMGGYATKEDALVLRLNSTGSAVACSAYCGPEHGREASYGTLAALPGPGRTRLLCCSADAEGKSMQAFELFLCDAG